MARRAVFGRGLIEEYGFGGDNFGQLVTFSAAHILMRSSQGKRSSFFVIEERGLPFQAVVAFCAARYVAHGKLLPMHIFVAVFALAGRSLEIYVD